jgi:hypothetical protein
VFYLIYYLEYFIIVFSSIVLGGAKLPWSSRVFCSEILGEKGLALFKSNFTAAVGLPEWIVKFMDKPFQ